MGIFMGYVSLPEGIIIMMMTGDDWWSWVTMVSGHGESWWQ